MNNCESKERGRVLKVLAELTERTGFGSAVKTVDEAVRLNATDPDSLQSLYRRTYTDVPLLPPLDNNASLPHQKVIPFRNDLQMLDAALTKGGASNTGFRTSVSAPCAVTRKNVCITFLSGSKV